MLKVNNSVSIESMTKGDVVDLFISDIGEVVAEVVDITDTEVILRNPYALVMNQNIGMAPVGISAMLVAKDVAANNRPANLEIAVNRSKIVYRGPLLQDMIDDYKSSTSGIQIAKGNVDSIMRQ